MIKPQYDPSRDLIKVRDAAELLNISAATVYRLIASGALKAAIIGKKCTRISRAEIDRYLDGVAT